MNHEALERIMHEVLDEEASREDRERLERALAESAEAREKFAELKSVFESLNAVQMVDAPEGLHTDVERALAEEAQTAREPRVIELPETRESHGPWYAPLMAAFSRRPAPALAATFASGTALGALLIIGFGGAMTTDTIDPRVAGQMGAPRYAEVQTIDAKTLELGPSRVVVETLHDSRGVEGRLTASSNVPVEIEVEFDPSAPLIDLRWSRPSAGSLRHEPGRLWFRHEGDAEYALVFGDTPSPEQPLRVTLRSQDGSIEEVVATDPGGK